jgi:sulfotransferase family protein
MTVKAERLSLPIFVVGYQRSGTTLLQALLGSHPRIAAPPETYFMSRIADLADYYGDLADDEALRRALHDTLNPAVPLFATCGFDEDRLFERIRAGNRSYRALLEGVMADFAARRGKRRWCEKTPGQPAASVLALFPEAQIVHIVRDPRDVIASSLQTPWTRGNAAELARSWRRFTTENVQVGFRRGPEGFLQIRYEDLTRDPSAVLRVICAFLGEAFDPEMLTDLDRRGATIAPHAAPWQARALEPVVPSPQGSWRGRLSKQDRARIAALLHREITTLGYEPPGRGSIRAGRLLNSTSIARPALALRRSTRLRGVARDPERRYREMQLYMQEQAARVGARPERTPPGSSRRSAGSEAR